MPPDRPSDSNVRPNRVVVLGSLNMDMVVRVDRLPIPGETVLGGDFQSSGGGKGANQAAAAARLGAKVGMIGCVGVDANGRELLALARSYGVNVQDVRRVSAPTGVALILVEKSGQNVIAVAPGANGTVTPAMVATSSRRIMRADVLVAQLEIPLETITAAASLAHSGGVPFILNAAPARRDLAGLLPLVTVLVVNETELAELLEEEVPAGKEAEAAARLLERGPQVVVVTLGERGSLLVDGSGCREIPAYRVKATDATAAGDAFVGAIASRYRGPGSLEEAARYASAVGAITCTRVGAQSSLPTAAEVEEFLRG